MTVQKFKNNNFWHGLFMGLIPILVLSALSVVQRSFWPIEKTDHSFIAVTFAFVMVIGFAFYAVIHFAYYNHRFKIEEKKFALKGLDAALWISIFIFAMLVHLP